MRLIVTFGKRETVRWVGHLDLQRTVQRALRRSLLPIRFSTGFHPHPILSFAAPLPVGAMGERELFDVALVGPISKEVALAALQRSMPPELPVVSVRLVDDTAPALMARLDSATWEMRLPRTEDTEKLVCAIPELLGKTALPAMRHTKKGDSLVDVRPWLFALTGHIGEDFVQLTTTTRSTERENLKPTLLLTVLCAHAGVEMPPHRLTRMQMLGRVEAQLIPLEETP